MTEKKLVEEALDRVMDPEIGMSVFKLGLIYDITILGKDVEILMTMTSPMCPYAPQIMENVKEEVGKLEGVDKVKVKLTFDPPWQIPEEVRLAMGL